MALGFFSALFLAIFSLIYFLGGADRLSPDREPTIAAAEVFSICHRAAQAEARGNAALTTPVAAPLACTNAAMTNAMADGLAVTGIAIQVRPATDVGGGAGDGRVVVTYLPNATALNGVNFNNVRAQFSQRFQGVPTAGEVRLVGGVNVVNSVDGIQARVPMSVPVGALALVTSVQP